MTCPECLAPAVRVITLHDKIYYGHSGTGGDFGHMCEADPIDAPDAITILEYGEPRYLGWEHHEYESEPEPGKPEEYPDWVQDFLDSIDSDDPFDDPDYRDQLNNPDNWISGLDDEDGPISPIGNI